MRKRLVSEHFRSDGKPKRRFSSREAALAHAKKHAHEDKIVYACDFCDGWHYATRRQPRLI